MIHFQEKRIIFLASIAGLMFLLISLFFILPSYQNIKKINQEIFDLRTQLEIKYTEARRIHKSQLKFGEADKLTDDLEKKFLRQGEELALITSLENLSEKNSLRQSLTLGQTILQDQQNASYLDLDISLVGAFPDLMRYLESLKSSGYFISITNLNLVKGGPADQTQQKKNILPLTINLKGQIYVKN